MKIIAFYNHKVVGTMKLIFFALTISTAIGRYWPYKAKNGDRYSILEDPYSSIRYYFSGDFRYDTYYMDFLQRMNKVLS